MFFKLQTKNYSNKKKFSEDELKKITGLLFQLLLYNFISLQEFMKFKNNEDKNKYANLILPKLINDIQIHKYNYYYLHHC